jgi:hypothetical protein
MDHLSKLEPFKVSTSKIVRFAESHRSELGSLRLLLRVDQ